MISVIIPSYRYTPLLTCLKALEAQKDAPEFQVLVAASEHLYYKLDKLPPEVLPGWVVPILCTMLGNGPAKNHVIEYAQGGILAFTDDDCIPDPYWLFRMDRTMRDTHADVVAGPCLPADITNVYQVAHQAYIQYHLDLGTYLGDPGIRIGTTMNLMITRDLFNRLGGFSEAFSKHYGDDFEFNRRWAFNTDVVFAYARHAIVRHAHPFTLKSLIKTSFRYGMGLEVCRKILDEMYSLYTPSGPIPNDPVVMSREDYRNMYQWVLTTYRLLGLTRGPRRRAAILAILMQEVKRIGMWYGKRHPDKPGKVYENAS